MKKILNYFFSILLVLSSEFIHAQAIEQTPAIKIKNLYAFQGQFLTVIFMTAESKALVFSERSLEVSNISAQIQMSVNSDEIDLPSLAIERSPFKLGYNFLVLVVSTQPNYTWINADGTVPSGNYSRSNSHIVNYIKIIDRSKLSQYGSGELQIPIF